MNGSNKWQLCEQVRRYRARFALTRDGGGSGAGPSVVQPE